MSIIIENNIILGSTGAGDYQAYKPWHHASGVERWMIDPVNYTHILEGYLLRLRIQSEIETDTRYIIWLAQQQTEPAIITFWIFHDLTVLSADGEIQADGIPLVPNDGTNVLQIVSTIRAANNVLAPIIPYTESWPIRVRRSDGSMGFITKKIIPSEPGIYTYILAFKPKMMSDRYIVYDEDFAKVMIGETQYQLKQSHPLIIDVYEAE
jgi:hypothetical protein